jgi:hypothetical protein
MTIERPPLDVYNFIFDTKNLPKWASGLASTPSGAAVKVRFVERNKYGVLDHYVSVGSGPEVYMPMRVFPNGDGSELLITVFRQPGVTEEKFVDDTQWVRRDLEALRDFLEKNK